MTNTAGQLDPTDDRRDPLPRSKWRSWVQALRPHHWAKNALMFLPAMAAHLAPGVPLALRLLGGFLAFSALASAVYLLNDIADRESDKLHPTKRLRPVASGEITARQAAGVAALLIAVSGSLAVVLPRAFGGVLVAYFVITSAYSLGLKKRLIVDVITLATLYTLRIIAGATLADVPLSRWFLAFSIFLFLSLSLVKRAVELQDAHARAVDQISGRGYRPEDLSILGSLGTAAAAASALVYCLYITGEDVLLLYSRPDVLWVGLPLFLYWIARLWVLAARGSLHDDPVTFALRDRVTYGVFGAFLMVVWLAT